MQQLTTTQKLCEIQISYNPKFKISERPKITNSSDAYKILENAWNHNTIQLFEEFKVLFLNSGNRVLGLQNLSSGGFDFTPVDPRIIFATALKAGARAFIIAHNHPSGNLQPSKEDIAITTKIKKGAELLGQELFDHIIITKNGYYSFTDEGIL